MDHRPLGTRRPNAARQLLLGIVLALPAHPALATTMRPSEVDDPIAPGQTCNVQKPSSYGSYIYHWPSRFDFVFWPFSDWVGVWHCKRSGFTALIGDFDGLSGAEVTAIRDYLASNYDGASDPVRRLELLEGIYRLRNKDPAFDNRLLRVLARHYQDMGLLKRANERRL